MSDDRALPDFARMHGWDREYRVYVPPEIPQYVGQVSFCKRPWIDEPAALMVRAPDVAIVGAPFDDAVSYRPGARFGAAQLARRVAGRGDARARSHA